MTKSLPELVRMTYEEDIPSIDVTSDLTVAHGIQGRATVVAKEAGIFFGEAVVRECVACVDSSIRVVFHVKDRDAVLPGAVLLEFEGTLAALLKLERVMLNFIQRLCGIASATRRFVEALDNPAIQILDTRKTTPLLRDLEKQAVVAGGGANHRYSLSDMVLIKENHLVALENAGWLPNLGHLLSEFKAKNPSIPIEIEIETLAQIDTLPLHLADYVMFDNFSVSEIEAGIRKLREKGVSAAIEISGNVTLNNIRQYRHLNIQRISIGALTHSVKAMDISMRCIQQ
ncbi:carboxylating nicotinate-nucleotide diphosphorylase [bacterium]|nr:carboxylating nicotinate-nucleotide diphosphorylase [bacterium]